MKHFVAFLFALAAFPLLVSAAPGDVDSTFDPAVDDVVTTVALQGDGKVLLGGFFSGIGADTRTLLARLNSNSSVDTGFAPDISGGGSPNVNAVVVQTDGKVLVGGDFDTVNGTSRSNLVRLNTDGTLDTNFNIDIGGEVNVILLQADGKVLIGGNFSTVGSEAQAGIARLLSSTGARDTSFLTTSVSSVSALALQSDGGILLGGNFATVDGVSRNGIARLNSNGSLDTSFNPNANGRVRAILPLAGGDILIGGNFSTVSSQLRERIARLNSDGTVDGAFDIPVSSGGSPEVFDLAAQADGMILVGGVFDSIDGTTRSSLGRLNSDGSLDTSFEVGANDAVRAIALQDDGKVVFVGDFSQLVSPVVSRSKAARVEGSSPNAAPTNVNATAGVGSATVSWTRVVGDISGYTVTSSPGGATCSTSAPTTTCSVAGLTNGTPHTFTVTASNSLGSGPASDPSNSVTPLEPTATPTATPSVTPTATPTATPSVTPTATSTPVPQPTATSTATPSVTLTATPESPTPTETPVPPTTPTPCFGGTLDTPRVKAGVARATVSLKGGKISSAECVVTLRGETSRSKRKVFRSLGVGKSSFQFKRLAKGKWTFFYSVATTVSGTVQSSPKRSVVVK